MSISKDPFYQAGDEKDPLKESAIKYRGSYEAYSYAIKMQYSQNQFKTIMCSPARSRPD